MKMYNPFRWHIAKNSENRYVVRKFHPFWGWEYLDKDNIQTAWSKMFIYKYCAVDSLETAQKLLGLSRGFRVV